jgi:hypothetical protein
VVSKIPFEMKGKASVTNEEANIPIFGEERRLYREVRLTYMVSSKEKPENYLIYSMEIELGPSVFYNDSKTRNSPIKESINKD